MALPLETLYPGPSVAWVSEGRGVPLTPPRVGNVAVVRGEGGTPPPPPCGEALINKLKRIVFIKLKKVHVGSYMFAFTKILKGLIRAAFTELKSLFS